jgi:hypothetical protein
MPLPRFRSQTLMTDVAVMLLYMAPFLSMLAAHWVLGLSDALMVAAEPGKREAQNFNLCMALSFYAGLFAAIHHLDAPKRRGWPWILGRLALIGAIEVVGFLTL